MNQIKSFDETLCVECDRRIWNKEKDCFYVDYFFCGCKSFKEIDWSDRMCGGCAKKNNCCRKCETKFTGIKCNNCE